MWKRAAKDTRAYFGWNKRTVVPLLLWAVGAFIYWQWQGRVAVKEELAVAAAFVLAPIGLFLILLYLWNLVRAPVFLKFEKEKEPCLEVRGFKRQDRGLSEDGFNWGLRVKNVGLDPARGCECLLQEIRSAYDDGHLPGDWPTEVAFYWQGQREFPHVIQGGQTNRLQVIYHNYAGPAFGMAGPIVLAYRAQNTSNLLAHDLSGIHEPILLLFSLVSEGKSAQYVLCRIDLDALVAAPTQSIPCTIRYVGSEEPNLDNYLETSPPVPDSIFGTA